MIITIDRIDNAYKMEATNDRGNTVIMDAGESVGGSNSAFRPMEMLMASLAGCSAIDVINILTKQKQTIDHFQMELEGDRTGGIPSPFTKIRVKFILKGDIKESRLQKAIQLTKDKYCSVLHSLRTDIEIDYHYSIN
jgi:putative redox protein